ncbi:MAG: hypothetical protein JNK46_12930 [Methylobacteriaceae bacterium]|nr:hypothetical protein [Methylobacteriaceae bacterium]
MIGKLSGRTLLDAGSKALSALPARRDGGAVEARPTSGAVLQGVGGSRGAHDSTRRRQNRIARLTAILFVLLPTLAIGGYLGFVAKDQFAVETRFAPRSSEQKGLDTLGSLAGLPSAAATSDSNLLVDFIRSPDLVRQLDSELGLRRIYGEKGDWFYRADAQASLEDLVLYWRDMIRVRVETASQSVVVSVRAFTAEDSLAVANAIVGKSEALINTLSEKAREETVAHARRDVELAEGRLRKAREDMRAYRDQSQVLDPRTAVEARGKLIGQMEAELTNLRSEMRALRGFLAENAPSVVALRTRIGAMESELAKVKANAEAPANAAAPEPAPAAPGASLPQVIQSFENLQTEAMFAERAYVAAMAAFERARTDADRNSKYLAVHVRPTEPQTAVYPRRIMLTLAALVILFLVWGSGWLVYLGVRDHMH